jgi:poly(A) polymerase
MEEHPQARLLVETLSKAGFIAYYAGGWVRDYLLKHPSDDIDIATNAPPETVQALFPHTVPIGISFGIILVLIDGHPYEVATFRQDLDYKDGRRPSQIRFATPVEDARRRDFTINGMFYDPIKGQILDYVDGQTDLKAKIIRAIGNPHQRIKEDRLRMIRAVRLACRFNFHIEPATEAAIRDHAKELFPAVAIERIWQEFVKGHAFGKLHPMLLRLHDLGLLSAIFPELTDLPLSTLKERLLPLDHYPSSSPPIASILALFPNAALPDLLALCKKLKLSSQEHQFTEYFFKVRHLAPTATLHGWAHLYANPLSDITIKILAAHSPNAKKFLKEHDERRKKLEKSIQRIKDQKPVVGSADLLKEGIHPGKKMGDLLKEAEKISINEGIDEPKPVIEKLKKLSIWDH